MLTVQQHSRLGKEILQDCDLAHLTMPQVQSLKQSLWEQGVIVVRKQKLTASQLKDFAIKTFGDTNLGRRPKPFDPEIDPALQSPGVSILGNPKGLTQEVVGKFAWVWHHDKDHLPKTEGLDMNALYVVMLYGVEIPAEGIDGEPHTTNFLDMMEAYQNLERQHRQQLEKQSMYHLSPITPPPGEDIPRKLHPIVSTHKITGRKGLYLGSSTSILQGLEDKPQEAQLYWNDLFATILDCTPVYAHIWQPGDIVFWDNSQVMHTGMPYNANKYKRIALRLGVVNH
ncbi:TauD/TfdA dioxygenase family protein [Gloeothece verrucosa]|uniref:Taurine catabolism dioxygenase TauD/TfdA n=1 Tax=Gloeothece verrucosa (strain PCC 7822) TaxID=497965 RepID=E0ULG5_GLOV7|nr:TauD/TfdA family dioxygenase [Gloeothece verrucosa]ADN17795.1 Taurine catabolism dioxygenase TauD/TfdA [Gloeothece verrucosa PCC 7822]